MISPFHQKKMYCANCRTTHLVFGIIIVATIIFYSTLSGRPFDIEIKRYAEIRANSSEKYRLSSHATNVTFQELKQQNGIIRTRKCGFFSFLSNGCGTSNITNVLKKLGEFQLVTNASILKAENDNDYIQKIDKTFEYQSENAFKRNATTNNKIVEHKVIETSAEIVIKTKDIYEKGHFEDPSSIKNICPNKGSDINLLILITSAPTHREQRLSIRQSWGHYGIRRDISIGFVLGRTQDQRIEDQLAAENYMYSDLIRGNSIDSYRNLTLKTISLLEWTSTNCPNATYLLKTDDDMFINVPKLLHFIETHLGYKRTIFGRLAKKWKPIRNKKSKYYVSPEQYFPPVFPPFTTVFVFPSTERYFPPDDSRFARIFCF
ncbi:uncharacterized protein LOC129762973 isoform X2 [Toxorhynchites rutilus septentrionalis]|uniref:uncharacterized protein LOC129762973 isoform X2 n=1 Tax=Toxorhynchites rutilus septentrionalis TaxID=329112 RepID=UPI002479D657|nr:uncharacterized protein LOC129762973 isoform X2 [Toxorhynchites rutilus septentrionalis]